MQEGRLVLCYQRSAGVITLYPDRCEAGSYGEGQDFEHVQDAIKSVEKRGNDPIHDLKNYARLVLAEHAGQDDEGAMFPEEHAAELTHVIREAVTAPWDSYNK
jgi:hypothetical protein